jgi:hypothetical protein
MPLAISSNCECRPIADRHCEFVIRCRRTPALRGPTNFLQKEVAMKRSTITSIALLAALVGSSAASAASYDYTPTIATSASPRFPTLGSTPSFRPPR